MSNNVEYIFKNTHISGFGHTFYITETEKELVSSLNAISRLSNISVDCFPEYKGNGTFSAKKYVLKADNLEIMSFLLEKPSEVHYSTKGDVTSLERKSFEKKSNSFYVSAIKVDAYAWATSASRRYKIPMDTILKMAKSGNKLSQSSNIYDRVFPFYYKRSHLWASDIFRADNSNLKSLESSKHIEPDWHYISGVSLLNPEMSVSGKYTVLVIHSLMEPQYADKGGAFRLDPSRRDRASVVLN